MKKNTESLRSVSPSHGFHTYRGVPSTQKEEEPQVPWQLYSKWMAAQIIGTQMDPPKQWVCHSDNQLPPVVSFFSGKVVEFFLVPGRETHQLQNTTGTVDPIPKRKKSNTSGASRDPEKIIIWHRDPKLHTLR